MIHFGSQRLPLLLCLLFACAPASELPNATQDQAQALEEPSRLGSLLQAEVWNLIGYLSHGRSGHTATLLLNGKVLVVGGISGSSLITAAEEYDPTVGTWSLTEALEQGREAHTATLLPSGKVLVVGGRQGTTALDSAVLYDPATGTWTSTSPLPQARFGHTAVMIQDKVLVVGGSNGTMPLASSEVYDPATGTWSPTGSLNQAREHHTATLLPTNKVLVVGGTQGTAPLASAEVYDPATGAWSSAGSLNQAREYHTATLLPGGKLLVVGGRVSDDVYLASTEEYDTATGNWSSTGPSPLAQARARHSATLLPSGKLLVVGGFMRTPEAYGPVGAAELYSPDTQIWSSAKRLTEPRFDLTATLLPGGEVLAVGGKVMDFPGIVSEASAEIYTPATGAWSSASSTYQGRREHSATLLPDGKVLVVGGADRYAVSSAVDVYDPLTGVWSSARPLSRPRSSHTATLLRDGKVLIVGGYDGSSYLKTAEVYNPSTGRWSSTGSLRQRRSYHTATLLPDGKVMVVGGSDLTASLASVEVYDPKTGVWSPLASLRQARVYHSAILLPGNKVLVLGGEENGLTPLASAEVYDVATGSWSPASSMRLARRFFTATLLSDNKILVVGGEGASHTPLRSTEIYTPDNGGCSAGSLLATRFLHTATLLPNGKVLVAGGTDPSSSSSAMTEIYNPATETWSAAGSLAHPRSNHTATLLPGGKVLMVGYNWDDDNIASDELYANLAEEDEARRPLITDVSLMPLDGGLSVTVTGERFRGPFEASGGNTQSSPTNYPMLSLSSVENSGWVPLHGHDFSDTSVSAPLPQLPNGYYLLHVTTQGMTSSRPVSIIDTVPPERPTILAPASNQPFLTSSITFAGTAEPGSTVRVLVDGIQVGERVPVNERGDWELRPSPLSRWGAHEVEAEATDLAGNPSEPSEKVSFVILQRSHYGMSCSANTTVSLAWPCTLLLLGLKQRRRSY